MNCKIITAKVVLPCAELDKLNLPKDELGLLLSDIEHDVREAVIMKLIESYALEPVDCVSSFQGSLTPEECEECKRHGVHVEPDKG